MRSMFGKFLFLGSILSLFFTFNIFAQDLDDVTISGKIVDSNGLVVVGATVTAIRTETGIERTVTTNSDGRYRIIELQPGTYSVKATAQGFGETIKTELQTVSGQGVQLNIKLEPAGIVVDPIEVTSDDAPTIDTTRTVVGGTITQTELQELPNSSGDVLDLVYTLGGVDEESISTRNLSDDRQGNGNGTLTQPSEVTGGGIFSLSGGAAYSTNITIDGLDNNDDRSAEERFQPPVDSVAEVQVITNQFSAEYGRASGGRINIRTKAGAKKFRGRAYFYFEDDNLNANTYNNNLRGLSRLPYTEITPGGTLSGPIPFWYFKNKTYFFTSYEYEDRNATTLIDTALPVTQNPLFPLPQPTNLGTTRLDKNDFPGILIADYTSQAKTPTLRHRFTQRFDHNFTDNHNITLSYQLGRSKSFRQYRETTRFLDETLIGRTRDNDSIYFTDNYIFSQKLVNQFRYQYSTYRPDFATDGTQNPVVIVFVSDDARAGQDNQVRGSVVLGNSTTNTTLRKENRHQFQDTANYIVGNQTLRFGGDIQFIESNNTNLGDTTGTYNFDNVSDFVTNQIVRYRRKFGTQTTQKNTYYGVFLQDDWRARSNLTLSFGLRYERETLVQDKNNFGPRFAVAYAPGDKGKSVFRFGAGVFYNRVLLRTLDDYSLGEQQQSFDSRLLAGPASSAAGDRACKNIPTSNANYNSDRCRFLRLVADSFPNPPTLDQIRELQGQIDVSRGFITSTNFSRLVQPDINIPESYQLNFGYERDLGNGFALEANFTYNKAVRLWRETNINAFVLPNGFATYTDYLVSLGTTTVNGVPTRYVLGSTSDSTGVVTTGGIRTVNLNTTNTSEAASMPIGLAFAALRVNLNRGYNNNLGQVESVSAIGQSTYKGLTVELRRRFRDLGYGFRSAFRLVYVLSRARDDGFVDTSSAQIPGDFKEEFSTSGIDRRHKFRLSGTMETPYWLGKIRLSPILRLETGRPFNISIGGVDRNLDDVGTDRPNFSGNLSDIVNATPGNPLPQSLIDQFTLAPIGTPGNLPRNAGRGPGLFIFDINFSRQFKLTERYKLQFFSEFDNIFNAKVFSFGSDFINFNEINDPNQIENFRQSFLVPTRTLRPRQVRLGVRFDF